ncbi:MAG: RHS repeat-associated core domain-containing protein, partial [Anaerolineae bacterium]
TDAAGSTWTLGYSDDDLVTIVDPLEAGWMLGHDDAHHLTAKTDPLGFRTAYRYEADGQLAEIIDPAGHRVTFETELNTQPYAPANVQTVAPVLGTTLVSYISAAGVTTSQHRYSYDGHGRVVKTVRSPDGGDTQYVWRRTWGWGDTAGLLLSETDAAGLTTSYSYRSGTALVEQVAAPPLPTVEYGYKQINGYWAVTSFRMGDQATLYWRYDAQGRRSAVEQGSLRWFYTFDAGRTAYGQPSAMVWNWNGQGDPERATGARLIRYTYDERGRLVGAEDAAGGKTVYGYDDAGRLVSLTDALGRTRTIAYDAAGRITRQVDALGGETAYVYDAAGNLAAVTDAAGSTTAYSYDHAARVTGITDPLSRTMTLVYGSEGELLSRTDARGDTVTVRNDALGRPLTLTYPGGQVWAVTYDAAGNVTTLSGEGLTRAYQRDAAGRVLQLADIRAGRASWVSYVYNASGQVAEMRTSDGGLTTYGYGSVGELKRITGPLGTTEYTYETAGQLAPQRVGVRSGPLRTRLSYDRLGQLASIHQVQQGQREGVDRTTRYTYDAVGNVLSIETPEGMRTYAYDELDRLVAYTGADGVKTTYDYDAVGNRTALKVGRQVPLEYRYDAAHQLLHAGDTEYAYDRNGRLISEAGPDGRRTYTWDYQGRLASVADRAPGTLPYPLGSATASEEVVATYRYALTGERVQTIRGDGALETYQYDGAHAVARLDEAGIAIDSRQQGAGWDEWPVVAGTSVEGGGDRALIYPLAEAHGTVVGAADDAGALVQQVAYDPWGAPLPATGEAITDTITLPGFQGHTYEADTGLYDLRARWYDPEVGRFISPDPVRAPQDPAGNPYAFGMNNPLRYTDPTGEIVPLIIAAALIGAAFYASYSGASYAFSTSWECFSGWEMARRIALGAAIGAAVGAGGYLLGLGAGAAFGAMGLSGLAAGIASGAVAGAGAGAGQSLLSQLFLDGRSLSDVDGGAILRSALIGALAGGVAGGLAPGSLFSRPAGYVLRFFMSKMTGGLLGTFGSQMLGI